MLVLVFLLLDVYLEFSLLAPFRPEFPTLYWVLTGLLQLLILSQLWLYFFFFKSGPDEEVRFEKQIQKFAFMAMGAISFLFSFTLIRDALGLILLPFAKASTLYGLQPSLAVLVLSFVSFSVGFLSARFRVVSPRVEVPIDNLPFVLRGLRIVQLSDVHLGTGPGPRHVSAMVERALKLQPDLIVLTGDIIDGMTKDMKSELAILARLKARYGVYFVLGNHECYWKWQDSVKAMEEAGVVCLLNAGVSVKVKTESFFIAGMNDPAIVHYQGDAPKIVVPPASSKLNIMLVHQPQFAPEVAKAPYQLQLSGHTHGGQFFPWNLAVKKIYPISGGLGKVQKLWVYVSHGSGYWGPPIRLGTSGEVTELIMIQK